MVEMNGVARLRQALVAGDATRVTTELSRSHLGVCVHDGAVATASVDGRRVLPVFLSHDSWEEFAPQEGDAARVLSPAELLDALIGTGADAVMFDPALSSAVSVPAADVASMLRGEIVDASGGRRVVGDVVIEPDEPLRRRIRDAVGSEFPVDRAWVFRRVNAAASVPQIAVAHGTEGMIERLVAALRRVDLPPELELSVLDAAATDSAAGSWVHLSLAAS